MNFFLIILIIFSFDNVNSADNCASYIEAGSNICQTCAANYGMNKDRTCSQCGSGQVSDNNYCFTKIDHCKEYILYQEGQKCAECDEKYNPIENNSACRLFINNCAEYENNEKCRSCENGYLLNNAHTQCIQIAHCIELNTNDKCKTCEDGFHLVTETNSEPYCNQNIEHCKTYETTTGLLCTACQEDYVLKSEACVYEPCSAYNAEQTTKCDSCKSGYYLIGDSCTSIEGCKTYDNTVTEGDPKCTTCESGYYLIGDSCTSIEGCKTYDNTVTEGDPKCTTCQAGFRESDDKKSCLPAIANCKTYSASNLCDVCNDGFMKSDGGQSCVYTEIDNCENQINAQCQQCETYYIKQNNACVPCDNTEGKSCGITIENCETYQLTSGVVLCTACSTGSHIAHGGRACVNDKAADGKTVISAIDNCIYYTTENKCGKCLSGFELINDKCYACPSPYNNGNGITCSLPHLNCLYYDNSGNCIACPSGYQLTKNHQYCIEEGSNDPTKNNNSCVLNLNILILMLFALLL